MRPPLYSTLTLLLAFQSQLHWQPLEAKTVDAVRHFQTSRKLLSAAAQPESKSSPLASKRSTITFSNPEAKSTPALDTASCSASNVCPLSSSLGYHVNGKTLPEVDFDVGDSWAGKAKHIATISDTDGNCLGLMPISAAKNETRKLFFWFFPSKDAQHTDDLM